MPFRLTNALTTFQATMNQTLEPFLRKFMLVFMDDLLIYSKSWRAHLQHVDTILSILHNAQLYAKKSKCSFGKTKMEYLGHIISTRGVKTDPAKISAIISWPRPTNITKLRGFLRLTGYYRRFIQNYAQITTTLNKLLKRKPLVGILKKKIVLNKLRKL